MRALIWREKNAEMPRKPELAGLPHSGRERPGDVGARSAWGQAARPEGLSLVSERVPKAHCLPDSRLQGLLCVWVFGTSNACFISARTHFELDLIEHPDTARLLKSKMVNTLMHSHQSN